MKDEPEEGARTLGLERSQRPHDRDKDGPRLKRLYDAAVHSPFSAVIAGLLLTGLLGCGGGGAETVVKTETVEKTETANEPSTPTPKEEAPAESQDGGAGVGDDELTFSFKDALFEAGEEPTSVECGQNLAPGGSDTDDGPDGWECSATLEAGPTNGVIWDVSLKDRCWRVKEAGAEGFSSPDVAEFAREHGTLKGCVAKGPLAE